MLQHFNFKMTYKSSKVSSIALSLGLLGIQNLLIKNRTQTRN